MTLSESDTISFGVMNGATWTSVQPTWLDREYVASDGELDLGLRHETPLLTSGTTKSSWATQSMVRSLSCRKGNSAPLISPGST